MKEAIIARLVVQESPDQVVGDAAGPLPSLAENGERQAGLAQKDAAGAFEAADQVVGEPAEPVPSPPEVGEREAGLAQKHAAGAVGSVDQVVGEAAEPLPSPAGKGERQAGLASCPLTPARCVKTRLFGLVQTGRLGNFLGLDVATSRTTEFCRPFFKPCMEPREACTRCCLFE